MNPDTGDIKNLADFKSAEEMKKAGYTIPLKGEPKKNCKKCYGRGHIGIDGDTGKYVPCLCVRMPKEKPSNASALASIEHRLEEEKKNSGEQRVKPWPKT